ncbi:MAG TPA: glycosyltransferase family 2 protein [Saprospiraceae bacterium]|nr:glycosyltransferase family 2 protein [Saprospiraceae bacterium]
MVFDVIIPAYNEQDSIGLVVNGLSHENLRYIFVCNNNSTDLTEQVAASQGAIVLKESRKGYGAACLKGINHIKENCPTLPDFIVFCDGDYADDLNALSDLLMPLAEHRADLVIGSRVLGHSEAGSLTSVQKFGNWLSTGLIYYLYKVKFTDLGPFRAIRWTSLMELNMQDQNFGWTVEMQVKAAMKNLRCVEIPVNYRKRIGISKVSGTLKGSFLAGCKILWTIFSLALKRVFK